MNTFLVYTCSLKTASRLVKHSIRRRCAISSLPVMEKSFRRRLENSSATAMRCLESQSAGRSKKFNAKSRSSRCDFMSTEAAGADPGSPCPPRVRPYRQRLLMSIKAYSLMITDGIFIDNVERRWSHRSSSWKMRLSCERHA